MGDIEVNEKAQALIDLRKLIQIDVTIIQQPESENPSSTVAPTIQSWYNYSVNKILKVCQKCGKSFYVYPYRSKSAKYCSLKCARSTVTKICPICGKSFTRNSHENLKTCSNACGKELQQHLFDTNLSRLIGEPIEVWLRHHYVDNLWTYRQICRALQINNRTLMRYMGYYNIPVRNPSEAVKTQWIHNPSRKLDGYKIAVKGAPRRAIYLRNHPQESETALIKELDSRSIKYEFQYPINSYILDFAFLDKLIDVEIDNPQRAGRNLDRLPKTSKRTKELQQLGWTVIYFRTDASPSSIADTIQSLIN